MRKRSMSLRVVGLALLIWALPLMTTLAESGAPSWTFPVSLAAINEDYMRVVNAENPLTAEDVPGELVSVRARKNDDTGANANGGVYKATSTDIKLVHDAAQGLYKMFADAEADGLTLYVRTGYRSFKDQAALYKRAQKRGEEADAAGATDQQTGLTVDVVSKEWRDKTLTAEFAATAEAQWLAANCQRYGFILRFPQGKENITGKAYLPWRLHYVGSEVARYIASHNLCLEEFAQQLANAHTEFVDNGGDVTAARLMSKLPEGPIILDEVGLDGDHEVTLFHD